MWEVQPLSSISRSSGFLFYGHRKCDRRSSTAFLVLLPLLSFWSLPGLIFDDLSPEVQQVFRIEGVEEEVLHLVVELVADSATWGGTI